MKAHSLLCALLLPIGTAACSLFGGAGLDSEECKNYFAKVDECAKKANAKGTPAAKVKAESWVKGAEISKANFEKNSNPLAVKKSCEMMLDQMKGDPACQ